MDKKAVGILRATTREITTDARRIRKAVKVLDSLQGFVSPANGEMEAAARAELLNALQSLQTNGVRIAEVIAADEKDNDDVPF